MDDAATPRVSILVPNYNNGKGSSVSGDQDLIGNLLNSLWQTLHDDPTPFEIIVYDDGSTDDGLDTLRQYASRRWSTGDRPFLELIEATHGGVLSKAANILSRRARGDILARLDGDVTCLTPCWVSKLCEVFDHGAERLGVVGPKQLGPDGKIIAFGDWVLHPCGYTHVAQGLSRHAVRHPMEVDHVMGCFYCCRKQVFEDLGGYDEQMLRGQTVDFGLRARLAGWFCLAVPQIEFVHHHSERVKRKTEADSDEGVAYTLGVFEKKWGFNRLAPDLDELRRRYAGTPLLWNSQWFERRGPTEGAAGLQAAANTTEPAHGESPQSIQIESSDWGRYAQDVSFRRKVDLQVTVTLDVVRQVGTPRLSAQVGSGAGLITHLLAARGLNCVGLDRHRANVELARRCTASSNYPATAPRYETIGDVHCCERRYLPLDDGEVDLLLLFEQMEQHENPVALLREARRVLGPNGHLLVTSRRRGVETTDPSDPTTPWQHPSVHFYRYSELCNQIEASGGWELLVDPDRERAAPGSDLLIVAAQRIDHEKADCGVDSDPVDDQRCSLGAA